MAKKNPDEEVKPKIINALQENNSIKNSLKSGLIKDSIKNFYQDQESFANNKIGSIARQLEEINRLNKINSSSWYSSSRIETDEEILHLRKQLKDAKEQTNAEKGDKQRIEQLNTELIEKEKSAHVLSRIHPDAQKVYLSNDDFKTQFEHNKSTTAVVVSIDIRRSTELMLKARSPEDYSTFITTLSQHLSNIIIRNYGIFDKFTGDGVLAFFPEFYSGTDAILRALKSAEECHQVFQEHYIANKKSFSVFIKDVGLGIGIDYGKVSIVNSGTELTVVGHPVVYACRFSGAKAGETLLNIEAFESLEKQNSKLIKDVQESEILIKHEGTALAYRPIVDLTANYKLSSPQWLPSDENEDIVAKPAKSKPDGKE